MQRNLWRALLLAFTMLLIGALPVVAQTSDSDSLFKGDNGSVLIGIQNDVSLAAGQEADGVLIIDGSALIQGEARGLVAIDADVTVQGSGATVDGIFIIGGSLTIESEATVDGVAYIDTALTISSPNVDTDNVRDIQTELAGALGWVVAAVIIFIFFIWIGFALAMLFSSLLVVAFGTSQVRRAAFHIGNDVLKTIVAGFLMMIVPWIVFILLAITVVGIPLAIGLMFVWWFLAFLGYVTVGLWIGERILRRARMAARPYGAAFLGVLILMLLSWIPLVTPLATLFGLGAVTLAGWRVLRGGGVAPVPPGYGQPYGMPYGQPQQVPPPPYAPPPYAPPPPPAQYPPQQGGPPASWPQG